MRRAGSLLLLVLAFAGCGRTRTYAERADGICRDRVRAAAALPNPRSSEEQQSVYERLIELERREVTRLRALTPEKGSEAGARALVRELSAVADAAERLRVASLSGDSESAQGAFAMGRRSASAAARAARALGLKICGSSAAPG